MDVPAADPRKLVTIVCPVFNEEKAVPLFYGRLEKALATLEDRVRFEILFVNNRSTDRTEAEVMALREKDPRVQLLTMSRNYGYQASISAGMRHASGDASVNIDVDCEDPPEMIPKFIERWLDGADIAYGIRARREEFVLMHLARKLFYRVTKRVSDHEIVLDMAEFFLVDRKVKEHVLSTRSTFPFVRMTPVKSPSMRRRPFRSNSPLNRVPSPMIELTNASSDRCVSLIPRASPTG